MVTLDLLLSFAISVFIVYMLMRFIGLFVRFRYGPEQYICLFVLACFITPFVTSMI